MIRLRLLGPMSLEGADGTAVRSVLDQPKRLALLAYLAAAHPPARHRRDILVGLFWPEQDAERARMNLRQTLHRLRRSLGRRVLAGRGRERVGIDPGRLWCDAAAFAAAVEDGRGEAALQLYRGEFLQGFHLPDAPEFERWMERERDRFRRRAVDAAWKLTDELTAESDSAAARGWADRALELAPYDDEGVRRYVALMVRLGQYAAAVRAYDAYAARLRKDLELEPSVETRTLIEEVRAGNLPASAQPLPVFPDTSATDGLRSVTRGVPNPSHARNDAADDSAPHGDPAPGDRDPRAAGAGRISRRFSRRAGVVAAILGFAMLAYVGYPLGNRRGAAEARTIRSMAVLPLEDVSRQGEQDWFAAGMHAALISELGKIDSLAVTSRTSTMRFANPALPLPEIADVLGVDALVEGSVVRAGEDIRISLQLIDGSSDRQLWSGSFDREMRDVLILQRDVARAIAEEIQVAVDPEERRLAADHAVEPEAYLHHLRGSDELTKGTEAAFNRALEHFRRAIAIDSLFAPPYAGLALAYIELGSWMGSLPPSAVLPRARAAALTALERDSLLAEAHIALGRINHLYEWDWHEAESSFRRGIELNPGSTHALWVYGNYLISMGRFEEAVAVGRRLVELDPLAPTSYAQLAWGLEHLGRGEEALQYYRKSLDVLPHPWAGGGVLLAEFHLKHERPDSAAAIAERAEQAVGSDAAPMLVGLLGFIYGKAGRPDEARRILNALEARAEQEYVPPVALAVVNVALGHNEKAMDLMERAFDARDVTLVWNNVRWVWDPLRDEPRFQHLLRRMGFPG